jgi:RNA polymerase sigma factor (TIGR02999 family)
MTPASPGDDSTLNELVSSLYDDLHRIAARHLRGERPDHTLQTTALLNEAYVKLSGGGQSRFNSRTHFLAVASRVMRQVLVDYARARVTLKRDGGKQEDLSEVTVSLQLATRGTEPVEILELNRALDALAREDEYLVQIVEMRYFGGMTAKETADAIGRSVHVIRHDLRFAQAWLRREVQGPRTFTDSPSR